MSTRVSQELVEVLIATPASPIYVSQDVVEVLIGRINPSPTTPAAGNIGISQDVIEVLGNFASPKIKVSQELIEVLVRLTEPPAGGVAGFAFFN